MKLEIVYILKAESIRFLRFYANMRKREKFSNIKIYFGFWAYERGGKFVT